VADEDGVQDLAALGGDGIAAMEETGFIGGRIVDDVRGPQLLDAGVGQVVHVVRIRGDERDFGVSDFARDVFEFDLARVLGFPVVFEDDRESEVGWIFGGERHHVTGQVTVGRSVGGLIKVQIPDGLVAALGRVLDRSQRFAGPIVAPVGVSEPAFEEFLAGVSGFDDLADHEGIDPGDVAEGFAMRAEGDTGNEACTVTAAGGFDCSERSLRFGCCETLDAGRSLQRVHESNSSNGVALRIWN
jgi:hypothetical protein